MFSSIALVCVISPGPAVLLSITNSLTQGVKKSVLSSLGNVSGILVVSSAAALGLGAVLQTSAFLFALLKIIGAFYLIFLGIRQWKAGGNVFDASNLTIQPALGKRRSFVQGFLVALSNPKAVLFFTAFFPQFLDLSKPVPIQFLILTATFMVFSFFILVLYALTARFTKVWFAAGRRALWFNRICGSIFVAFGIGVLRLKNRSA